MEERSGGVLAAISIAALTLVVALPLSFILLQAVFPRFNEGSLADPFGAFASAFGERGLTGLVLNTLALGAAVAAGCFAVSLPLAVLRASGTVAWGTMWDVLFLIPFMIPPYIAALAWTLTLQPGGYATQLFGFDLSGFLFSFWGIVAVMILGLFPVVYFALSRTFMIIGQRFADVGRVFGASGPRAFFRITLPLATPGVAASLLIVFALTIEEYGTPATLGRQAGFSVLVTSIEERFAEWPIDIPGAAILSLILVALALAAYLLQNWVVTRRSFVAVAGKAAGAAPAVAVPLRWRIAALALFSVVGLLAIAIPVLAVIATAASKTLSGGLAWSNLGFDHFREIFDNTSGGLDALLNSFWLATGTALGTGVLGALVAYVVVRTHTRGRAVADALSVLPNALPGMVVAVGLILAWNREWWPVVVYNTPVILLLGYICIMLPYTVRYASAALRQVSPSLDAAARVSGAGNGRVLRRILLPLMAPNLLVAMLLVFAIATRELVTSIMLAPPGLQTVSIYVFRQFEQGSPGSGMALSVLAIFSSTAILVALAAARRRGTGTDL